MQYKQFAYQRNKLQNVLLEIIFNNIYTYNVYKNEHKNGCQNINCIAVVYQFAPTVAKVNQQLTDNWSYNIGDLHCTGNIRVKLT